MSKQDGELNEYLFNQVTEIIKPHRTRKESKKDGVVVIAIHHKKGGKKGVAQAYINGIDLKVASVILRDIYGKIYEMSKRSDKKMQKIDETLREKKGLA